MENKIKILILDDVPSDAALVRREIQRAEFESECLLVETKEDFIQQLNDFSPDIVLSDYAMPQFTGMDALEIVKEQYPLIPLIIVTGSMNEETAVECMKTGAADYVIKEHLTRLGPAITGALNNKKIEKEIADANEELIQSSLRWQNTFDSISDMVSVISPDHLFLEVNKTICDATGLSREELIGRKCYEIAHGTKKPIPQCPCSQTLKDGMPGTGEHFQDGKWYSLLTWPVLDDKGKITAFTHIVKDITERKRAEETLKENEDRYRQIYQFSPDSVIIHDMDMNILNANNKAVEEFGYSKKELLEMKVYELHSETELEHSAQVLADMKNKDMLNLETEFVRKNGSVFLAEITPCKYTLESKQIIHFVIRDITERKQAEEALQESEERFRVAGVVAYDLIYEWDVETDSLEWFGDIDGMLGFGKGEISQDINAWLSLIHPDDVSQLENAVEHHRKSTEPIEYVYRIRHKDGKYKYFEDRAQPLIDSKGRPYRWIGVCTDITERKLAEAELRKSSEIINRSPAVAFLWRNTENWPAEYVSENVKELFGYSAEDFLTGKASYAKVIHQDDLGRVGEEVARFSKDKEIHDFIHQPYRIITSDGLVKWIDDRTNIIRNENGEITHYQGIVLDVTERKRAEEALQESEKFLGTIIENIPNMIFVKGAKDLQFVRFNKAGEELLGCSREELFGKNDYDFFPKVEADFFTEKDRDVLSSGRLLDIPEESIQTKHKGERILHTRKIPINNEEGMPQYLLGISEDITESKQAEEDLKKRIEEVDRTNKLFMGREYRIVDMKREVNELLEKSGQPKKYKSVDESD
ncbi:MAG: PAS domain S-box protein [Candidatus Electryonea clarkiae]|nr:PAS domain S-box protein [Candidatus Electryonea clarkiae]MDP8286962.1 PAS domain S-box protein [Candidatus Electryonea clarkiae]